MELFIERDSPKIIQDPWDRHKLTQIAQYFYFKF